MKEIEKIKAQIKELSEKVKSFEDKEFSGKWEDLEETKGYYISDLAKIFIADGDFPKSRSNKNIVPTIRYAKSILAFCQLSQIVERFNELTGMNRDGETYSVQAHAGNFYVVELNKWKKNPLIFNFFASAKKSIKVNRQLWKDYFMID